MNFNYNISELELLGFKKNSMVNSTAVISVDSILIETEEDFNSVSQAKCMDKNFSNSFIMFSINETLTNGKVNVEVVTKSKEVEFTFCTGDLVTINRIIDKVELSMYVDWRSKSSRVELKDDKLYIIFVYEIHFKRYDEVEYISNAEIVFEINDIQYPNRNLCSAVRDTKASLSMANLVQDLDAVKYLEVTGPSLALCVALGREYQNLKNDVSHFSSRLHKAALDCLEAFIVSGIKK